MFLEFRQTSNRLEIELHVIRIDVTIPTYCTDTQVMFESIKTWITRAVRYLYHLVLRFNANNGLLLSAAVSYKILLSFIPLIALLVVGLSFFFPEDRILGMIRQQVELHFPGQAQAILDIARSFLESRDVFSGFGFVTLVFFSGIGFRVLRDAIRAIFHEDEQPGRRFWISMLLPYLYIGVLGLALFAITLMSVVLEQLRDDGISLFGYLWKFDAAPGVLVSVLSMLCLMFIFSSLYKILPVRRVAAGRALIGGAVAAILWDITRRGLVYYFNHFSSINVFYGSLATIVVVLVTLEIAAGIVLFGAQVTADLERNAVAGRKWYEPTD